MVIRQASQEGRAWKKKKSLKDGCREDEAYFGSGKNQEKECHEVQLGRLRPNMRKKKCHSNVSWCNRPPRGGLGHPRASCFKE